MVFPRVVVVFCRYFGILINANAHERPDYRLLPFVILQMKAGMPARWNVMRLSEINESLSYKVKALLTNRFQRTLIAGSFRNRPANLKCRIVNYSN
jgi:hypothetical protein